MPGPNLPHTFHLWLSTGQGRQHPILIRLLTGLNEETLGGPIIIMGFPSTEHSFTSCEPQRMEVSLNDRASAAAQFQTFAVIYTQM